MDRSANRFGISVADVTFALFCLIPPLVFGSQLINADGDVARHISMGRLMLENGLFVDDPFSFTWPGHPIVLTEWGSRILYALAYQWAGLVGVGLLAGLLIGASCGILVLFLLRRGVDPLLAWFVGMAAALIGQVHWLARPHLFTLVFLALLLFLLEPGATRRRPLWFAALFALWVNLHGGFVLGLVLIGTWMLGALIESALPGNDRSAWLRQAKAYGVSLVAGIAGSMLNPGGPDVFLHVFELLGNTVMTSTTSEFLSPDFHGFYGRLFLMVLGGVVAVLAVLDRRPSTPRLLGILLMLAAALVSRRNIPLFGMVVFPILALHANEAWKALPIRRLAEMRSVFDAGERLARPGRLVPFILAVVLLLGVTRGSVAGVQLIPSAFDDEVFPVEAVQRARAAGLDGRLFSFFPWGGYVIHAWPEQQIFIDGMTDFFPQRVLADYYRIYGLGSGWAEALEKYDIGLVLVPPDARLSYQLLREPGWKVWHQDSTAVLIRRVH